MLTFICNCCKTEVNEPYARVGDGEPTMCEACLSVEPENVALRRLFAFVGAAYVIAFAAVVAYWSRGSFEGVL